MKKVLIIGNPNSQWIREFIRNYLLQFDVSVSVAGFADVEDMTFYKKMKIVTVIRKYEKSGWVIRIIRKYMHLFQLRLRGPFDVIHIHYVSWGALKLANEIRRKNGIIIASYYGSDLFRTDKEELTRNKTLLETVDQVTFDNIDLKDRFEAEYGKTFLSGKRHVLLLGLTTLEQISRDMSEHPKTYFKNRLGIREDSITIAIGYNRVRAQQHLEVLEQLQKLPKDVLAGRVTILLQMTYGFENNLEYIDLVEEKARQLGCEVKVFREFLTEEMISMLRIAADIYINAQTTDAFSGSVCEFLFADTVLVNAGWLHYKELDQYHISYVEFHEFHDLPDRIRACIDRKYDVDIRHNKKIIEQLRRWSYLIPKWKELYRL